jgi:hypothetical protein
MRSNSRKIFGLFLGLSGIVLLAPAILISNSGLEQLLVSDPTRSLSWGTTLFRVLLGLHATLLLAAALMVSRRDKNTSKEIPVQVSSERISRNSWLFLGLLSIVAFVLRVWRLDTDLWFDELLTLLNFVRLPWGDILTSLPDQNNHILFSLLAKLSVVVFHESAWAVRLPSVVFGVLSLWPLYLLGRRIIGNREALLACALATFSYHHVWFSQNARGYMALLFFSLLATWLWLEALERDAKAWWFAYAVAVTLGILSHLTMAFVVAAHIVVYTAGYLLPWRTRTTQSREADSWNPFFAWALAGTMTLQLYALALPEFLRIGLHEVSLESEWTSPMWVVRETLRSLQIGFPSAVLLLCGAAMFLGGWINLWRRKWQTALLLVLPGILAGSVMLALGHNLWPRFFFFCLGFALLIAIHGAMLLPRVIARFLLPANLEMAWGRAAGLALAGLMIVVSAATLPRNYLYPKQDYSGARDYVETNREATDAVVAVGLAGVAYERYFAPRWSVAQTREELQLLRRDHQHIWLVYTLPVEVKTYRPEVWQEIQSGFEVVKVFPGTLGGGEVYVCRQLPGKELVSESGRQALITKTSATW